MGFFSEFKDFAMRGNVVDLAVGLIIGAEFGKIINSGVNDLIMPPIGKIIGGSEFTELKYDLGPSAAHASAEVAATEAKAALAAAPDDLGLQGAMETASEALKAAPANITINYGSFIQNVFNFLIIAFAVFMVVKIMNSMQAKEEEAPAEPPKEEVLLGEIRDLLAKKN